MKTSKLALLAMGLTLLLAAPGFAEDPAPATEPATDPGTVAPPSEEDPLAALPDNQTSGSFAMQLTLEPDKNETFIGTANVLGKLDGTPFGFEQGYVDLAEGTVILILFAPVEKNQFLFFFLQVPVASVTLGAPVEIGKDETTLGLLELVEFNDDGSEVLSETPLAWSPAGQVTFSKLGTNHADEVVGTFSVSLEAIAPEPEQPADP